MQSVSIKARSGTVGEVFRASLRLGLTSFGGPIAHLGYFRDEYVIRRKWLDEPTYADLVALCQFLPGPVSSKVGIAIGQLHASYLGAIAAWIGFTLPSAVALVLFAYGVDALGDAADTKAVPSNLAARSHRLARLQRRPTWPVAAEKKPPADRYEQS